MKKVFVAKHPAEAHLVRGLLEAEGIRAEVQGESLFGARGQAPVTPDTLPTVWIAVDEDLPRATELLAGFDKWDVPPQAESETWSCPQCGERVEGQFQQCWRCGAERPV